MDLKQALHQQRGTSLNHNREYYPLSESLKSDHEGGGHHSSSSNSTNTGDSNGGNSHAASFYGKTIAAHTGGLRRHGELHEAADNRVLKLARFHDDPPSPPSTSLETQSLIHLHGCSSSSLTANHSSLTYLSNSANNSNHPSPTSNYPSTTSTLHSNIASFHSSSPTGQQHFSFSFNGGAHLPSARPLSKLYPFTSMEDSRPQYPLMLSATAASSQGTLSHLSTAARSHQLASFHGLNPVPAVSLFTPGQLLELTQQTYVFKHFTAGVTPPPSLLLPIFNSVASSISNVGAGPFHFGTNAGGLYNVGTLRGHLDLEPGRCRRTDGKKWRCAREVVPDQKYCERHMHRGRHRARGKQPNSTTVVGSSTATATATAEPLNESSSLSQLPFQNALGTANTSSSNASNVASGAPTISSVITVVKEPKLQFSLHQPSSTDASRSLGDITPLSANYNNLASARSGGVEQPPNLADLLKGSPSSAPPKQLNLSHLVTSDPKCRRSVQPAFPFACQTSPGDADNLVLRQFVGQDWPNTRIINRVTDPPPPASLSWIDLLAEEQRKRNNTELSMATHTFSNSSLRTSPLISLSSKFGDDHDEMADIPNYMGLSVAASAKSKLDEDRYCSRSTWIPIAWDNPSIGGPLAEALQSNVANSGGNYSGSLANNGGEGCLNLIEESWDHDEHVSGSPAKGSHSPSLASPTGVLQVKASYSDSSSSASSPRASALKLVSAANNNLAI